MTMSGRHQPKHFTENTKDTCKYCRRTPAMWHKAGNEKVCAHCGTRVYDSSLRLASDDAAHNQAATR